MGLISNGGENLLDFLELRQVLSTYDGDIRDPIDCSLPGSSIHGIFHARVLEWGAIAFSEPLFGHL